MYDGTMHGMMAWFGPIVGVLFSVLLLVLLVLAVVWLYQQVRAGGSGDREDGRDPQEILAARYASGEISEDEYRTMKEELG
jgi:uncharacterized membrane protein